MTKLDYGAEFSNESDHLDGLLERRDATVAGRIPFGISFIDDILGGVYPKDLFLLGADSGVGKTALAVAAAIAGVRAGKRVHMFALEAERGEVAERLYFTELGILARESRMDYSGWARGQWADLDKRYGAQAKARVAPLLSNLKTLYKNRGGFTALNLRQQLEGVANQTDMIVLDHLHIIDGKATESEMRVQQETISLLADLALVEKLPVVVVSHLRKTSSGATQQCMPTKHDFHGHSDIFKKATCAALIAPDWVQEYRDWDIAPTFMQVCKDRKGRSSGVVASIDYVRSTGCYKNTYALGRMQWENRKQSWVPVDTLPYWAKKADKPERVEVL